ncbi:MAG: lamin tail domain-containing protein [Verrucomicrobiota bacterium]|nr:lamin tail domain-containing protein [Verrucomicrobiota bacterium]
MDKTPILCFFILLFLCPAKTFSQLGITEFAANNEGAYLDEDGDSSDWIEIQNSGPSPISTKGYHLTDNSDNLKKWTFPDEIIAPNGILIVFASGKNRNKKGSELHTNFSLSSNGEYLALVGPENVGIATEFSPAYPKQFNNYSYGFGSHDKPVEKTLISWPSTARWIIPDNNTKDSWNLSKFDDSDWFESMTGIGFGYNFPNFIGPGSNTSQEMRGISPSIYVRIDFSVDDPQAVKLMDLSMHFEDAVVVYLNGHKVISESAPESPGPNSTALNNLNSEVFSGDPMKIFSLDFAGKLLTGENVLSFHLMNNSVTSSDILLIPKLVAQLSSPEANTKEGYFNSPTPGKPNSTITYTGLVKDTTFSIDRGFFSEPLDVLISCKTIGSAIIYTIDGSEPGPKNGIIIEPENEEARPTARVRITKTTPLRAIGIKTGLMPSNTDTQTYIFLDDVLDQDESPEGYPVPWKNRSGQIIGGDYGMDPNVVGSFYTREEIKEGLMDIPTVSIVTDKTNLFDQKTGIQVNSQDSGDGSERLVSVELINFPESPTKQLNAGMRMNGNASRSPTRPKHNFRLIFRDEYGSNILKYPLFGPEAPTDQFNSIILRGGNGNSWIHPHANVYLNAMYIRDQWFRDAHSLMGYPEALQREVHVYFNGLYWGMHHLFERIEEEWTAERFGGNKDDWEGFRIVAGSRIEIIHGTEKEVSKGILDSWDSTILAAKAGDLETVKQYLDLDSFIDYLLLNFHAGNSDWDQNNVRAMRRISPPGKYMFFCHDAERAGFNAGASSTVSIDVTTKNTVRGPTSIHNDLRKIPAYAIRFADRAQLHLLNGGALSPENGARLWKNRADGIRLALKAESARWGDFRREPPLNLNDWERSLKREYEQWFPFRTPKTLSQLRSRGLYPKTEAPDFSQHGGQVPSEFSLEMNNPNAGGTIYYTLDGSDPRISDTEPEENILVPEESPALVLVQSEDGGLGLDWTSVNFDDSQWQSGQTGMGFEKIAGDYQALINFPLSSMLGTNASCMIRIPFNIPDQEALNKIFSLALNMKYDDGYAAFINGEFVAGKNNPETLTWNSRATRSHLDSLALEFESVDISNATSKLRVGKNILAIQAMNSSRSGSDFLIVPQISYGTKSSNGLSPSAIRYNAPVSLSKSGTVKARILEDGTWSALNQAQFIVGIPAKAGNLVISEIHYNPSGPSEENEFIELMNISDQAIQLTGVSFSTGIQYTFEGNATLDPMARTVLNPGDYTGQLDNGGENITLLDADGNIIESFRYNDKSPWPEAPDGNGPSLVRIAPEHRLDPELASSWRPSVQDNGNPGSSDASSFEGNNLREYAFGKDSKIHFEIKDDFLHIHYPRRLSADDLIFTLQSSVNMKDWIGVQTGYDTISSANPGPNKFSSVTMRSKNKIGKERTRFLRILVRTRD